LALFCGVLGAEQKAPKEQAPAKEQAPPEEDETLQTKQEYAFNPLQAEKEVRIGEFYFKKGSYLAAANRFIDATKWNPGFAEAYFWWGEAEEKLKDKKAARGAWSKFLELAPEDKRAGEVKKKLGSRGH
jgi:outer membrane protein assembly factor BamD (BamD/ComL family)